MKTKGFTLVELLIASLITVTVLTGIFSLFHTALRTFETVDVLSEAYRSTDFFMRRIEVDLKNCFIYTAEDSGFKGNSQTMEFFSVLNSGSALYDVCKISYVFDGGITTRTVLKNLEIGTAVSPDMNRKVSAKAEAVTFHYARYQKDVSGDSLLWEEQWPPGDLVAAGGVTNSVPVAVKVSVEKNLTGGGGRLDQRLYFEKIIPSMSDRR
ncbi:MAG: prepilin-type N-terminal cleavage/methylation domain-containing protein [Candidatus Omnitrophica bacterium]|nr:prepilin-type N-terminal cleavage/methylation domain-containing protein [Candidatus Omnitrophota bacterium]